MERLGEAVNDILNSGAYQALIPEGMAAPEWAEAYPQRHDHKPGDHHR